MKLKILLWSTVAAIAFASCGEEGAQTDNKAGQNEVDSNKEAKVLIEPTEPGPEFPGAALMIKDLKATAIAGTDSVSITVNYAIKNYDLKMQTSDAANRNCNNSKEGQHIHFILDNTAYVALYEPTHTFKAKKGEEHLLLSFLSRSYHLSLKNKEAYTLVKFKVDEKGNIVKLDTPKEPMLFYSRPKGTYIGEDAKNLLLDFYIVNADLEKDGLGIQANINGVSNNISKWQPYILKGLPMGQNKIQLNLVKSNGEPLVDNGFTSVSREFVLSESEPIKN